VKLAAKPASGTRFALPGVANHPTVGGGTLLLFDSAASAGGLMSLDLPHQIAPLGWRALGDSTNPSGFQYRAAGTSSDPCTVTVKATGVKILCRGDGVTLAPPVAGAVGLVLSLGAGPKRYCASFGGVTVENSPGRLRRRTAPLPATCPTPPAGSTSTSTTVTTSSTTSTLGQPDADGDGVPDTLDRCPGGDDRIDLDRDGAPDACQELAVRSTLDSFDAYASDAALNAVWTSWAEGGDLTITRGVGQGEGGTTAMRLAPIGPDPGTGSAWASVSRAITGSGPSAYDGIVLHLRHMGSTSLGLGINLTESNGEPWSVATTSASIRPDGGVDDHGSRRRQRCRSSGGVPGLLRSRRAACPSWHTGPGDGARDGAPGQRRVPPQRGRSCGEQVHRSSWWWDRSRHRRQDRWPHLAVELPGLEWHRRTDRRARSHRAPRLLLARAVRLLAPELDDAWGCVPRPGGSCIGLSIRFTPSSLSKGMPYMADLEPEPEPALPRRDRYRDAWATYSRRRIGSGSTTHRAIASPLAEGSFTARLARFPSTARWCGRPASPSRRASTASATVDDTDDDRIDQWRVRDAIGDRPHVNSNDRQAPRMARS
jgi:hypothetical protein